MTESGEVYLPVPEAARRIGVTPDAIHTWIRQGRVRAVRLPDASGRLYVLAADLKLDGEAAEEKPKGGKRARSSASRQHREAVEYLREVGVVT